MLALRVDVPDKLRQRHVALTRDFLQRIPELVLSELTLVLRRPPRGARRVPQGHAWRDLHLQQFDEPLVIAWRRVLAIASSITRPSCGTAARFRLRLCCAPEEAPSQTLGEHPNAANVRFKRTQTMEALGITWFG